MAIFQQVCRAILVLAVLSASAQAATNERFHTKRINLINNCKESLRLGFTANAVNYACSAGKSCPRGYECELASGKCYFNSVFPGGFLDMEPGNVTSVPVTVYEDIGFGGSIYASTGCKTAGMCETAMCTGKACAVYQGPLGPHSRAEFFFNPNENQADFYDVSYVEGANLPMTLAPSGPPTGLRSEDPFRCTVAGAIADQGKLGACSNKFNTMIRLPSGKTDLKSDVSMVYNREWATAPLCKSDGDCQHGQVCGLAAGATPDGDKPIAEVRKVCGKFVGLWNAQTVCGYSADSYDAAPYNCRQKTSLGGSFSELYRCAGKYANSGYVTQPDKNIACGCDNLGLATSGDCVSVNPEWSNVALPFAEYLKRGCPTAYSYPFDDKTSTFTCDGIRNGRTLDYTVEICPGGQSLSTFAA